MINIAICDDDIVITNELELILQDIAKRNFIKIDMEVFWDAKRVVELIENGMYFDIIFLDIEIGEEDGITIARRIRKTDKNVLIIYITSYESYMQESFVVRPFRFLLKPIKKNLIELYFLDAYEEICSNDSYFRYNYQRLNRKILIREIIYFESERRKVHIVTQKGVFEFYGKLNDVEKSLTYSNVSFLRVHQSFLVNYKHLEVLAYDFVIMDNGKRISISEDRCKHISEQYCKMEDKFDVIR